MMMVAPIMGLWIGIMALIGGIQCFILADDLLILVAGNAMMGYYARALNCTHKYLQAVGARVAPTRSFNLINRESKGIVGKDQMGAYKGQN